MVKITTLVLKDDDGEVWFGRCKWWLTRGGGGGGGWVVVID